MSAVADGPVVCIEVLQTQLIAQLKANPGQSGRLFKAMAIALADRISELSGKLRAQVTSDSTSAQGKGQTSQQLLPAAVGRSVGGGAAAQEPAVPCPTTPSARTQ